ncbi:hypothetical protein L484_013901 [Morus notabilis]|uniref:Hepatocellular carcinoma-associated antigen 59 n=1 Tax=Morus notabilis TaxID=981085 RepID=W9RA41_9ROSA|nr:hypothetical protein L484_013901 [Morus notabilis]
MEEVLNNKKKSTKNFRKRSTSDDDHFDEPQDEQERRMALEEVKLLQKQRQRKLGILAVTNGSGNSAVAGGGGGEKKILNNKVRESVVLLAQAESGCDVDKDKDKDDLVLQDTFAQETAVMLEDPNMLKYVEQELAKKRGRKVDETDQVESDLKRAEDELYKIPDHLKVSHLYKLRNIEETEAAKKLLQEKRLTGRAKSDFSIPSSYTADYFQRGRDYAEKLRREHPELYKDRSSQDEGGGGSRQHEPTADAGAAAQRQAATDQFMLERFRKRERLRVMRR